MQINDKRQCQKRHVRFLGKMGFNKWARERLQLQAYMSKFFVCSHRYKIRNYDSCIVMPTWSPHYNVVSEKGKFQILPLCKQQFVTWGWFYNTVIEFSIPVHFWHPYHRSSITLLLFYLWLVLGDYIILCTCINAHSDRSCLWIHNLPWLNS